jgi:erythromycin esterase-like protein
MRIAGMAAGMLAGWLACAPVSAAAPEGACALPILLPAAASSARLVFLGEYHGTQETPLFAAEYACLLASQGARTTLALEMLQTEQPALDAYLRSDGGDEAQRTLLSTSFWRGTRDGRASTGTLAMIERIRVLRSAGLHIDLLPLDGVTEGTRDQTMAAHLRKAMDADAARRFVVLAGNMHTRKAPRSSPPDPGYDSLAYLLRDRPSVALNVLPQSGAAWVCQSSNCGPKEIKGVAGAGDRPAEIRMGYSVMPGYDGTVLLPKATVAEPAAAR